VAEELLDAGATVIGLARSLPNARHGARIDLRCDLTDPASRARAMDAVLAEGVPDLVVNNAGAFALAPFDRLAPEALEGMLAVNLKAPLAIAQALLPPMRARGTGRHVLIGSVADLKIFPGNAGYSASKFGARAIHEVLREELRGSGIGCTLVSPGAVDTPLWDGIDQPGLPRRDEMLRPEDVARAVLFVAASPPWVDIEAIRLGRLQ
jgi:NAD(P)-dependent dehydrogenase (short-subunit alcohol dehydrogenase family)